MAARGSRNADPAPRTVGLLTSEAVERFGAPLLLLALQLRKAATPLDHRPYPFGRAAALHCRPQIRQLVIGNGLGRDMDPGGELSAQFTRRTTRSWSGKSP